ncbi:MAG TPA: hypothetical protein VGE93_12090, partial [Bryobacteraceae bacterium]
EHWHVSDSSPPSSTPVNQLRADRILANHRHAGSNVLLNELIQVETKFGFEFEIDVRTAAQRAEPQAG